MSATMIPTLLLAAALSTTGPGLTAVSQPPQQVPNSPAAPLSDAERLALSGETSADLPMLRAGAGAMQTGLDASERSVLAERQDDELADQRAAGLAISNSELTTIFLVLGIIVLVLIIV